MIISAEEARAKIQRLKNKAIEQRIADIEVLIEDAINTQKSYVTIDGEIPKSLMAELIEKHYNITAYCSGRGFNINWEDTSPKSAN